MPSEDAQPSLTVATARKLCQNPTLGSDCSRLRKALAARRDRCSRRWAAARSEDGHTATARPLPAAYPHSQRFCLVPVRAAGHLELRCPHDVPRTAARRREHSMRPDGHNAAETAVKTLLPVAYRASGETAPRSAVLCCSGYTNWPARHEPRASACVIPSVGRRASCARATGSWCPAGGMALEEVGEELVDQAFLVGGTAVRAQGGVERGIPSGVG